jgi:DNA-binding HxlR family transcriptional regulator
MAAMVVSETQDGHPTPTANEHTCDAGLVRAFEFLGKRWNGIILGSLSTGPVGYAELRRSIGTITDSVLSDRLTELSTAGLVERTVTDTRPPGVTYGLTAAGSALLPILRELAGWADRHLPTPCVGAG